MADYSNPYGSAYARAQANKQVLERLEKSEKKKQEEELKNQKEREEIARNIKRREERMRNQEFGIVDNPWTATVVPKVETPSPTMKKKERRRTGDFSDLQHINKSEKKNNKKTSAGDGVSDEVVNLLRANQEAQRKEILNLTEQLDAKTREVIALRLTLNEVKEERKKINAEARAAASRSPPVNKAYQSAGGVPVSSPPASSSPSPERHAKEIEALKEQHEKEQQNLNWQLQMRDLAIEKLKESLAESKGIAQQAQALAEKREEQCKTLAVKTRELIENAKLKEADYFLLQEELKKTKALLVSMLREKNG